MITIEHPSRVIPAREYFDQQTNSFVNLPELTLAPMKIQMEHSLISIRKWEAKHHRPFSEVNDMTNEELIDYIRCMTINSQKDDTAYKQLTMDDLTKIIEYIADPSSAWEIKPVKPKPGSRKKERGTSEAIYYAMIQYGIPWECEKWHINSLMALIDYCYHQGGGAGKSGKSKTQREMNEMYHRINEANRKKYNSRG